VQTVEKQQEDQFLNIGAEKNEDQLLIVKADELSQGINIGQNVFVDIPIEGDIRRCRGNVLGRHKDDFVVLRTPVSNSKKLAINNGDDLDVRFYDKGNLHKFKASLIGQGTVPVKVSLTNKISCDSALA